MLNKLSFIWSLALLVTLSSCGTGNKSKVYSEWSLQSRETGTYIYEQNGRLILGALPQDDSYLWIMEKSGEDVLIRNKKSGNYLKADESNQIVCAGMDTANVAGYQWHYGGYDFVTQTNAGWYTLLNRSCADDLMFRLDDGNFAMQSADRNNDFNVQWNFVRENGSELPYEIGADYVVDASFLGLREAKAVSETEIVSDYHGENTWKLKEDISAFPQFSAANDQMLVALYNLALEETRMNIRTDSTFLTGALWPDTWTRDAVYSIFFTYSWILPEISKLTLEKQTLKDPREALQDTGSGGSWPVSTDRVVWAMAAWEYYLSTGSKTWLEYCYEGLSNTARKDIHVAFNEEIGLFRGETCSMDWRTHTYPNWFSDTNIFESYSSGTNALHLFMYQFLDQTGKILNKPAEETALWQKYHSTVKQALNDRFWSEKDNCYTVYLYPEFLGYRSTQRVGSMANGLCAILGASTDEQIRLMTENLPLFPYGAAVLYPTIPDDFSYHNKSVWPVWETPYMYAAKKVKNLAAVEHIMKSLIRQGAMFLTHKENMTYDTGYDRNTALNSDRQLWSVATYIGMVYRIIFGLDMTEAGLTFNPVVPEMFKGPFTLKGFKYRNASLDITVEGYGTEIESLTLDGVVQDLPFLFLAESVGEHLVEIKMKDNTTSEQHKINIVKPGPRKCWSPVEPVITLNSGKISWQTEPNLKYRLSGINVDKEIQSPYELSKETPGFYSVYAVDEKGFESDLSNYVIHSPEIMVVEAEDSRHKGVFSAAHPGYSGRGFVVDLAAHPADLEFKFAVSKTGDYAINLIGANGHGRHGTYCAIRSAFVDDVDVGTFIFDAFGDWTKWLNSNYLMLKGLKAGEHTLKIRFNPERKGYDDNMSRNNENANDCNIDCLRIIRF